MRTSEHSPRCPHAEWQTLSLQRCLFYAAVTEMFDQSPTLSSRTTGWRRRTSRLSLISWTRRPRICWTSSRGGGAAAITTAAPLASSPMTFLPPWWIWSLLPKASWPGWTGEIWRRVSCCHHRFMRLKFTWLMREKVPNTSNESPSQSRTDFPPDPPQQNYTTTEMKKL